MADPSYRPFRWEDLDQRLFSFKLQGLAQEMQKGATEAQQKAASDAARSDNSASYPPRLFEAQ
jgi:hypothetical protein